jgi:hypothetical protein
MPDVRSTRLPIPHLFMVLTIGFFAVMLLSAFVPAPADDGRSAVGGPSSELGGAPAASAGCRADMDGWHTSCPGEVAVGGSGGSLAGGR